MDQLLDSKSFAQFFNVVGNRYAFSFYSFSNCRVKQIMYGHGRAVYGVWQGESTIRRFHDPSPYPYAIPSLPILRDTMITRVHCSLVCFIQTSSWGRPLLGRSTYGMQSIHNDFEILPVFQCNSSFHIFQYEYGPHS